LSFAITGEPFGCASACETASPCDSVAQSRRFEHGRPLRGLCGVDLREDVGGKGLDVLARVLDEAGVPDRVEVRLLVEEADVYRGPALVVRVAGVEGLVDVADEVDQELERLGPLALGLEGVGEDRAIVVDRLDDVPLRRTVPAQVELVDAARHLSVVVGRAVGVLRCVSDVVGPVRERGERHVTEEVLHGHLGVVVQQLLGDRPDDLVTLRSPRDENEYGSEQR
jgi:hypothetical protein